MTIISGQEVEIAWPCEHDGMHGKIIKVDLGFAYCQLFKRRGFYGARDPVVVRYPSSAYIPANRKKGAT